VEVTMPIRVRSRLFRLIAVACFTCLAVLAGCGGDDDGDEGHEHDGHAGSGHAGGHADAVGPPSGATCPDDADMLTYETFGKPFVEAYCTRCHSSEVEGSARNGAPGGHDFDSLAGILLVADHVDQKAASGPDSNNVAMPPNGDKPSLEEREMLGEWLACER
jgi:hypothetical protein